MRALPRELHRAPTLPKGTPLSPGGERRQLDRIQAQRRATLEHLALLEGGDAGRALCVAATGDEASRLRSGLLARLGALDEAEVRILDGPYGRCEVCGDWIPLRQLELTPAVTRCAPCVAIVAATAPPVHEPRL